MKLKEVFLCAVTLLALTSCKDLFEENNLKPDGSKPSVTVISPTNNQVISKANGVHIAVSAVDKDAFKEISFVVDDAKGGKAMVNFSKAAAKTRLALDTVVAVDALRPGEYTLLIRAIDKRTNHATQEVKFRVM